MKVHRKIVLQGLHGYIVREENGQIFVWKKTEHSQLLMATPQEQTTF